MSREKLQPGPSPARRRVSGALGGSRILAHPKVAAEVAALGAVLTAGHRVLLEIGFDHGRRLTSTAQASPAWSVVGLEVRRRRVEAVRRWAEREELTNLHAFRLDARALLAGPIPEASCDVVEALFPTPWPEGRDRRRLLVTPDLVADVARALVPGGVFYVATDVAWYADRVAAAIGGEAALAVVPVDEAMAIRPPCPQRSRREWRCEQDGLAVYRFAARRRGD